MAQPDDGKTESEILFETFCTTLGIPYVRIPCGIEETPDYDITLGGHQVVTEVKQFEPNDDDERAWADFRSGRNPFGVSEPGRRVRNKIKGASTQLKARSRGKVPALLVLYDNATFGGTDATDIKTAMYGDEKVVVSRSSGEVSPVHPGGHRQCTAEDNTSISAIGLMYRFGGREVRLDLFHNHFAAVPIDPEWFRVEVSFRHFAHDPTIRNAEYEWREA
jgi:hypothetical protein